MEKKRFYLQVLSVIISLLALIFGTGLLKDVLYPSLEFEKSPEQVMAPPERIPTIKSIDSPKPELVNEEPKLQDTLLKDSSLDSVSVKEFKHELTVMSNVTAKIYVNEVFMGLSNRDLALKEGRYLIKLTKDGFETFEDFIKIPARKLLTIELEKK